ncbi:MAG: Uma2 family endonuclease [Gemmataceae bacterium]|nr:Uma2 family endonuclease [Gemmataceae bacterium]
MTPTPATPAPAAPPLMTAEEFIRLHGDESGVELVNGRVVRSPMPGEAHGEVGSNAHALIHTAVKQAGLGRVFINDTFIRTKLDGVRGADVCFVSYARPPKDRPRGYGPLEVPPDLVIEVRSPSDRSGDIQIKVGEYLNAGVRAVVVLDPKIEAATIYTADEDIPQRRHNGDELTLPGVLPGFSVPVRKFFE